MARRSVGDIEVTVEANTSKMTATLIKEGETAGRRLKNSIEKQIRNLDASIDTSDFNIAAAEARLLAKKIEASLHGLEVDIDFTEAVAQLEGFQEEAEAFKVELDAALNPLKFRRQMEAERERQEADELKLALDMKEATLDLFTFKEKTEHDRIQAVLELDTFNAQREHDIFVLRNEIKRLNLEVDENHEKATFSLAAWKKEQEANAIDVPVDVDTSKLDGGDGGGGKGLSGRMKLIMGAVVALMEPAMVGLQGLFASLTSLASSAFSAISGGALAAAPAIAALGASVATLVIGFQGMGDSFSAVNEEMAAAAAEGRAFNMEAEDIQAAMAGLAPAAQEVVGAFAEMSAQFSNLRSVVQQTLFSGLAEQMKALGTDALPAIQSGLVGIAGSFNDFFSELLAHIASTDLGSIFEGLQPIVDSMLDAFLNLFDAVQPFLVAAAPAAQALAESFAAATESLSGMVSAGQSSGALTQFLLDGVDSLRQWMELLEQTGRLLFTVFEAGKSSGDGFIATLTDVVAEFNGWLTSTDEGKAALTAFFDSGKAIMSALVPILEGLKDAIANIVTPGAIQRFAELAENIGNVLPVLGSLFEIVGRTSLLNLAAESLSLIADAIEPIIPAAQDLASALGAGLRDIMHAAAPSAKILADGLGRVMKAITPLLPDLASLAVALLQAFEPIYAENIDRIATLIEELAPLVGALIPPLINLVNAGMPLVEMFASLAGPITTGIQLLGDLAGALTTVTPLFQAFTGITGLVSVFSRTEEVTANVVEGFGLIPPAMAEVTGEGKTLQAGMAEIEKAMADKAAAAAEEFAKQLEVLGGLIEDTKVPATETGRAYAAMAKEMEAASEAASAMSDSFDLLVGRNIDLDSAARDVHASIDEMNQLMKDGEGVTKQTALGFNTMTEAGRATAETIQNGITAIGEWGAQALESGMSAQDASLFMNNMRDSLVDTASQFFTSKEEARKYIDQLGLTPSNILTMVQTPGLLEARIGIMDFDRDLDGIPNTADVEFNLPNVETIRTKLAELGTDVTGIPDDVLISFFAENAEVTQEQIDAVNTGVADVNEATGTATVSADGATQAATEAAAVTTAVEKIPDSQVTTFNTPGLQEAISQIGRLGDATRKIPTATYMTFSTPGLQEALTQVGNLKGAIDGLEGKTVRVDVTGAVAAKQQVDALRESIRLLQDKTVTVRTNNVATTTGGMSGAMITGPRTMNVGELGYTEALVPLQLPLNRVDPSVRDLAALIRGEGPTRPAAASGKTVNNFMTIQPVSADPVAVATQVINRSAMLANR